ncbi:MAG: hypothetical protein KDD64_07225 [Bdellovibrionales bacterium]|nr:hypothetical protein [Bdellovibrionales bacterium]
MAMVQPEVGQILPRVERLKKRVEARFSDRNICDRMADLHGLTIRAKKKVKRAGRPIYLLRFFALLFSLALFGALGWGFYVATPASEPTQLEFFGLIDAIGSGLISLVVVLAFVFSLERKVRRGRIIEELERLLSLVLVIDAGQQEKEPLKVLDPEYKHSLGETDEKPLTATELARYLEYSSEMASAVKALSFCYLAAYSDEQVQRTSSLIADAANSVVSMTMEKRQILADALGHHRAAA